jgi:hypothetical protein
VKAVSLSEYGRKPRTREETIVTMVSLHNTGSIGKWTNAPTKSVDVMGTRFVKWGKVIRAANIKIE